MIAGMKPHLFLTMVVLALGLGACTTPLQYQQNTAAAQAWLGTHAQPATADFNGGWHSEDWGDVYLSQTGRQITGFFGKYRAEGVVSGTTAYLVLADAGWYSYSVALSWLSPDRAQGFYSDSVPYRLQDERPIVLHRIHLW